MRTHSLKMVVTTALILSALLAGCGGRKKKYGPAYDPERIRRGIPPIGPEGHTMSDCGLSWNYDLRIDKGRHWKDVTVKNGELVEEMDVYKSGQRFTNSEGGQGHEALYVTYSYEAERRKKHPWSAIHRFKNGRNTLHSLQEIEDLLNSWDVDRLAIGESIAQTLPAGWPR